MIFEDKTYLYIATADVNTHLGGWKGLRCYSYTYSGIIKNMELLTQEVRYCKESVNSYQEKGGEYLEGYVKDLTWPEIKWTIQRLEEDEAKEIYERK